MPRAVTEFRIIVASPSDAYNARKAAFDVIAELNKSFEIRNVSLRGLGWEEVTPGVAAHPQVLINEQILKEYDILIAIFGTKLGSPTASAASGTVEEIETAIANVNSPMGKYRVQVYFRDRIDSTANLSGEEFKKLLDYRDQLGTRGVLYRLFKDEQDLGQEIRLNLQRSILEFLQGNNVAPTRNASTSADAMAPAPIAGEATEPTPTTEELGLLDHAERAEDAIQAATSSLNRIADLIKEIGDETDKQVAIIEKVTAPGTSAKEQKAVINSFAGFLKLKAVDLKQQAVIARESFTSFVSSMILTARIQREFGNAEKYQSDVSEFLNIAEGALATLAFSREQLVGLRLAVENIPRLTMQFNQAKKELLDALNECLQVFAGAERGIFEITAGT
jgi:hypothetical protein